MPPYDYNDIRNQDWYNRLVQGVKERTTASIRRSGADPNDPYWRAKEAQGLGDLSNARQDAFRRAFAAARERQMAYGVRDRANVNARQKLISRALKAQYVPSVGLGTMRDETAPSGISPAIPEPIPEATTAPMEAYPRPTLPRVYERDLRASPAGIYSRNWSEMKAREGGFNPNPTTAGYNPTVFQDNELNYRKKRLDNTYADLARRWR